MNSILIIVPTKNSSEDLSRLVKSLIIQTYLIDIKLIHVWIFQTLFISH